MSYIGYKTEKIAVDGQTNIRVVLSEDSESLDEVVVIGYGGTRARRDLTGSVGSVSGAKLAAVPVTSAAVALQGKVAGVQVTTVDGQPGADINIRVRGATSVTQSNDPSTSSTVFRLKTSTTSPRAISRASTSSRMPRSPLSMVRRVVTVLSS